MTIKRKQDETERNYSPCWSQATDAQALRTVLANGDSYVFPYVRLAFIRAERAEDKPSLRIESASVQRPVVRPLGNNMSEFWIESFGHVSR